MSEHHQFEYPHFSISPPYALISIHSHSSSVPVNSPLINTNASPSNLSFLRQPHCSLNVRIRIRIPLAMHTPRGPLEMHHREILAVVFFRLCDSVDGDFHHDEAGSFGCLDWRAGLAFCRLVLAEVVGEEFIEVWTVLALRIARFFRED